MQKDTSTFIKTMLAVLIVIGGATGFNHALVATQAREQESLQKYKSAEDTLAIVLERRQLIRELARIKETGQATDALAQRVAADAVRVGKLQAQRDAQAAAQATSAPVVVQPVVPVVQQTQTVTPVRRMQPITVQVRTTQAS
ncbi:hypothetical protein IPJ70_01845 [Candidatus Campbellbacteria bacterium]|nr:MAG: hypothetical protein IPJ70_01845 [Candidatus Campbellbacteria bacterium]